MHLIFLFYEHVVIVENRPQICSLAPTPFSREFISIFALEIFSCFPFSFFEFFSSGLYIFRD